MKKLLLILITLAVILFAAYVGVGYAIYDSMADISDSTCPASSNLPDNFGSKSSSWRADFDYSAYFMPDYETVSFPSREAGIDIAGWYVTADRAVNADAPSVILVHGVSSCRKSQTTLVPAGMLHKAGFNVLMIDVRDAGDSTFEDGRSAIGNEEYQDVLGAWDWLIEEHGQEPQHIGILGNSLGAATTLIAFSQEPQLAAAFVDSPFDNPPQIIREELARQGYPTFLAGGGILAARLFVGDNLVAFDPSLAIDELNGRSLFILHGTGDTRISVQHTYQLRERAEQAGADVTFWLPEGVEHVRAASAQTAEYEKRLTDFFTDALK